MIIGIDYGGVCEFDEDSWTAPFLAAMANGHEIFLLSHSLPGGDAERRVIFCEKSGIKNITFWDIQGDEAAIARKKAGLVYKHSINLFIDDYANRCEEVYKQNPGCICIISPPKRWQAVQAMIGSL